MPRALSLQLPNWSIDLLCRRRRLNRPNYAATQPSHRPPAASPDARRASAADSSGTSDPAILLVHTVSGAQRIAACCARSAAAGIRAGMTLAHARALLPDHEVLVEEQDVAREERALHALAAWALRFTPLVAPDPPHGLLLDVTGCDRLFHGERRLLNMVANSVRWLGFQTRVGIAPTFVCAQAVAQFGLDDRTIISPGEERAALSSLPVEALRLDPDIVEALREVNVTCIGHLLELPRLELAARFGSSLLLRLDQAFGEAMEHIDPVRPCEPPRAERAFDGPVQQLESVMLAVRGLLDDLCANLQRRESGVRRLQLDAERIDAAPIRETLELSRPSRHAGHLWSLLRPRLERLHLGFGVERLVLTAADPRRLRHEQARRWQDVPRDANDGSQIDERLGELVDTLSSRLGSQRVIRVRSVESYVPERAFRCDPALSYADRLRSNGSARNAVVSSERPPLLLERPERIEVMALTPDGPPQWFRWRGEGYSVLSSFGPERISHEWWRGREGQRGKGTEGQRDRGTKAKARRHEERNGGTEARKREGTETQISRDAGGVPAAVGDVHDCPENETTPRTFDAPALIASSLIFPHRDYFRIQDECGRWHWIYHQLPLNDWFLHGHWT